MSTPYPEPGSPPGSAPVPGPASPAADGPTPGSGAESGAGPAQAGGSLRTVGVTVGLIALGAPLGLLWAAVTPRVPMQMTSYGLWPVTAQPEEYVAADGTFTLLGLGFGVLAAVAVWYLRPGQRGPVGLAAAAVGCLGAGVLGWRVGRWWGLAEYTAFVRDAPVGATIDRPVDLLAVDAGFALGVLPWAGGVVLLPALGAAAAYTLLAGWSAYPSLRPEPEAPAPVGSGDQAHDGGPYEPGGQARDGGPSVDGAGGPPAAGDAPGADDSVWRRPTGPLSSDSSEPPARPAAPAPPGSGEAGPSRG